MLPRGVCVEAGTVYLDPRACMSPLPGQISRQTLSLSSKYHSCMMLLYGSCFLQWWLQDENISSDQQLQAFVECSWP